MVQQTSFIWIVIFVCIRPNTSSSCSSEIQGSILSSIPRCSTRPTLVDLRTVIATDEDVLQIMPEHVVVERCGGSCYVPPHSCNAVRKSVKKVPVMMVMNKWPHGEHEMVCSVLDVEVDEECECGCELDKDSCLPGVQYFQPQSCRCVCGNVEERAACIVSGKVWDPTSCQCHCPSHTWQACSSGYQYDYTDSCSCIPLHMVAANGAVVAAVLLSAALVITLMGGTLMLRTGTGVFKEMSKSTADEQNTEVPRTRLMTQKSKMEFDLANR